MKWSILTLTMPTRTEFLARLRNDLHPQLVTGVEWGIQKCNPQYTLGENRDMLRRSATGEYLNFVDDDDTVPPDYVSSILPLLDGVDQVGFDLQCYIDGKPLDKVTHHTLSCGGWYEDDSGYWRDISHINPMRRELALSVPMEGGHGEDHRWADRMRGKVKTEHCIHDVMYHYYFRSNKNKAEACPQCASASTVRVEIGSHCNACGHVFNPHPEQKSCLWV